MHDFFVTPQGIALILSTIIFLIAILLVVFRLIGFWQTLLFLCFSLVVGVVVGNFNVLGDYLRGGKSKKSEYQLGQIDKDVKEESPVEPSEDAHFND